MIGALALPVVRFPPPAVRLAYSVSAKPLRERCENWARAYALRRLRGQANSFEGNFRCNRFSAEPGAPPEWTDIDIHDAQRIEDAAQLLPLFEHMLLRFHYIRKWHAGKCMEDAADWAKVPRRQWSGFPAALNMAHALLTEALEVPAVVRKVRVRAIAREALDGED